MLESAFTAIRLATGPNGVRSRIKLSSENLLARLGAGVAVVQVLIQRAARGDAGGVLCTSHCNNISPKSFIMTNTTTPLLEII